ncbi:MAG: FKBP-type peptidyl-prolyl cis-trans isomerase [Bacteroidales bacterium]|nr:FKBP-type peptidyl-prolyl cis-trans isomerase [Bacteroidales bacterium]
MKTVKLILPLLCLLAVACRDVPVVEVGPQKGDTLKESLINANRIIAQSEDQQIDAYLERRGWSKEKLPNGVWVAEYENSETPLGQAIGYEDTVAIRYRVETLGGNNIYDWRTNTVICGHLQPIRGLDAALRTLHSGATARVIVPSEQAYGVLGDGDRIRTRMVLVYIVEVEEVRKSNN